MVVHSSKKDSRQTKQNSISLYTFHDVKGAEENLILKR